MGGQRLKKLSSFKKKKGNSTLPYQAEASEKSKLSTHYIETVQNIKNEFSNSHDLRTHKLQFGKKDVCLVYFETLCNEENIEKMIIKPLLATDIEKDLLSVIPATSITKTTELQKVVQEITNGYCAIVLNDEAYLVSAKKQMNRSIEEPENEHIIRGSHLGFIEDLNSNILMVRSRIENSHLTIEYVELGKITKTKIAIVYISNLTNEKLIQNIKTRISDIQVDFLQTPGYIEEFIEDRNFSPFPQLLNTERPDRVTSALTDGRAVIMMEGSPIALIAPSTFISFFQSPDDYNARTIIGSFYRVIRFISFFIAVGLPALYIALVSFHYQIIPIELLFTIKTSLEPVPFPPLLEALFMALTLELIREAAVRLPNAIAQTIGVVGGLVIGNAVVDAYLVSNIMIIIIALTAIASFLVPSNEMSTAIRILGFPFMLLAATFGLYGIVFGFIVVTMHLCKLESFQTPYFAPFAPFRISDNKDTVLRFPTWMFKIRQKDTMTKYDRKAAKSQREWDENNE